ncbi:hypothetical protein [Chryseobacterium sp. R2A-55]|uniref:hypothetical protein n=1 Tax=Chryseobacterium sp. R2A-55 TaxID=2744445 RepID=UPI001F402272|nr:hypothetical protein [Chryseobacterium sp. R2A-55]
MVFDQFVNDEKDLAEFVEHLNLLDHYQQYLAFNNILELRVLETVCKNYPRTNQNGGILRGNYQKWYGAVNHFTYYVTVKIDYDFPEFEPEMNTGFYADFFFHTHPADMSGISQDQV